MPRPTKEQIDEEILDTAAGLFARHGVEQTSIQRIADAVGYSKTGLLHRFPTKEAIEEATITHTVAAVADIGTEVQGLPVGRDRDQAVLDALLDATVDRPGLVAFMLTGITRGSVSAERLDEVAAELFRAFGLAFPEVGPAAGSDDLRTCVRITSAVCGLVMASLAFSEPTSGIPAELLRADLVEAALGALGHPFQNAQPENQEN